MLRRSATFCAFLLVVALLASLALDSSYARTGSASSLNALIEKVKRAVVIVNAFDEKDRLIAQGSGFFIEPGRIVTNFHVVGQAARVEIIAFGGETFPVKGVVALEIKRDLVLLQVENSREGTSLLTAAKEMLNEGEEVLVVSNPQGSQWEVSRGKSVGWWLSPELGKLVQITAPIARGSSGGAVVNLRGQLVGIATMSRRHAATNQYFAVPGGYVANLLPRQLIPFPLSASD